MPTIIDSLIVELGLDPSKFTEGKKKAVEDLLDTKKGTERVAKEIEESGKQAARFFTQLRNQALEFFALFTAGKGIKEFIADVVTGEAATGRLARQLGLSVEGLSAWQGVAERAGGTAAGITAVLAGLTGQVQQFSLTGEAGPAISYFRSLGISVVDLNGHFKTASELMLELADRVQGMDPVRAAAMVKAATGADPATVALILQGRAAIEAQLAAQQKLSVTTKEDSEAGQRLIGAWNGLLQSSGRLGQILLTQLEPAITGILKALTAAAVWVQAHPALLDTVFAGATVMVTALTVALGVGLVGALGTAGIAITGMSAPILAIGAAMAGVVAAVTYILDKREAIEQFLEKKFGTAPAYQPGFDAEGNAIPGAAPGAAPEVGPPAPVRTPPAVPPGGEARAGMSDADTELYIRAAATKRSIDPDIAVEVWRREGRPSYTGDRGSSFGPFQLHYGGVAAGGNAVGGLGDTFTKETGLDARDPGTTRQQIDFALDQAAKGGWGPWHGWKGTPWAGISAPSPGATAGGGGSTTTVTNDTKIGSITVHTQATDAEGIARGLPPALERNNLASQANYGNN